MKAPFAYVLYIDRGTEEHLVSLYHGLDEAEAALRAFAVTIVVGPSDNEIVEALAEERPTRACLCHHGATQRAEQCRSPTVRALHKSRVKL